MRRTWIFTLLFLLMGSSSAWASANRTPAAWGTAAAKHRGHARVVRDHAVKIRTHRLHASKVSATKTAAAPQLAGDPVLFGDSTVESAHASVAAGVADAFAFSNATAGTTASISVYVGSSNTAKTLYAGLYNDNNKHPGSLVVSGSLSSVKAGAWNNISVPSAVVSAGRNYWLAVLGTGGTLRFRYRSGGGCVSEVSSQTGLGSLASAWKIGTQATSCPVSAYVNGYLIAAPSNMTVPAITGTTAQGQTLTSGNGTWTGSPTSYSTKWQDCDTSGNNCATVSGATGSTYTLAQSDVGHTIRSTVAATNSGGTTTATSNATATIAANAPTASFTYSPGSPQTGQSVHFDASASKCYATPCTYSWADSPAGGTSWSLGTGQTLDYTFSQATTKYVTLTVTDATNQTATIEHDVVVSTPPVTPPANSVLPAITGTTAQGQTLTSGNGTWTGSPTSYSTKWQDCDTSGNSCATVSGATGSTYTLAQSDVGHTIRSTVAATNSGGTTTATSNATATIAANAPTASFTYSPGSPQTGQSVHFDASASKCYATPCTYSWADSPAGGTSWSLGTGQTLDYTFSQAATKYVTLTVTDATNQTATIEHDVVVSTPPVTPPANSVLPAITGTTAQGQTLTSDNGTWTGSPTSYGYQWRRCDASGNSCVNVSGATSATYALGASDVGATIDAVVRATNAGGSTNATSQPSAVIQAAVAPPNAPSNTTLPAISGTATQGQSLSTTNGSWTGSPASYAYQWQDCDSSGNNCTNISGATANTHLLATGDVGETVRVVVKATNAGGSTSATAPQSAVVAASTGQQKNCVNNPSACGYPDSTNSGLPTGTVLTPKSGNISANTAGQTISNIDLTNGTIVVTANGYDQGLSDHHRQRTAQRRLRHRRQVGRDRDPRRRHDDAGIELHVRRTVRPE